MPQSRMELFAATQLVTATIGESVRTVLDVTVGPIARACMSSALGATHFWRQGSDFFWQISIALISCRITSARLRRELRLTKSLRARRSIIRASLRKLFRSGHRQRSDDALMLVRHPILEYLSPCWWVFSGACGRT